MTTLASSQTVETNLRALKHSTVSGFFYGADLSNIWRGNVEEWVAWGFWDNTPESLTPPERAELSGLVEIIAEWFELGDLREGTNPEAPIMRMTLDKVKSRYRPLVSYVVSTGLTDAVTNAALWGFGFTVHNAGTLGYWRRAGTSTTAPPIVFCHGLGVGVFPYLYLLHLLSVAAPERDVFCLELPHIKMSATRADAPSGREVACCIREMLESWPGGPRAHFVGHSFGTVVVAWLVRNARDLVDACTFIDPVPFLLAGSDVCWNFLYRGPTQMSEVAFDYFLTKELHIAHALHRNFVWHENVLWTEDLFGEVEDDAAEPGSSPSSPKGPPTRIPTLVSLSGQDSIIPSHSLRQYFTSAVEKHGLAPGDLRLLWFPDFAHAGFVPSHSATKRIVENILALGTPNPVECG